MNISKQRFLTSYRLARVLLFLVVALPLISAYLVMLAGQLLYGVDVVELPRWWEWLTLGLTALLVLFLIVTTTSTGTAAKGLSVKQWLLRLQPQERSLSRSMPDSLQPTVSSPSHPQHSKES